MFEWRMEFADMSDQTADAFANIAARKLERDQRLAEQEIAATKKAKDSEYKWQKDKSKLQSDYEVINKIIVKHSGKLAIAEIYLKASIEYLEDSEHEGRTTVFLFENGSKTKFHINFNLRSGSINTVLIVGHICKVPGIIPIQNAGPTWYEAAILSMMEQVYPAPKA